MFSDFIDGVGIDLLGFAAERRFATILADPPWQFTNKTESCARAPSALCYRTLVLDEIKALPVAQVAAQRAHLYLWCPNALLPEGLAVMKAWGFAYKSNLIWHKVRKDCTVPWSRCWFLFPQCYRNNFVLASAERMHERSRRGGGRSIW